MKLEDTFFTHFEDLEDPRQQNHHLKHNLIDIIALSVLGTLCGANTMVEICEFSEANFQWRQSFLELKHGVPSHDTFERVFWKLDPTLFEKCFRNWIQSLDLSNNGPLKKAIAIDGKTSRGSACQSKKIKPIHTVAAWVSSHKLMLGQIKTEEKSNQMTAIPKLLEKVRDRSRMETRKYSLVRLRDCPEFEHRWPGLQSIGRLIVKRTENHQTTESTHYFVTSLAYDDIDNFMHSARKHWDIEIHLHWSLDVAFREDANRMRVGFSAENVGLIRRIALNLLKQVKTHKRGIESRRKRAGWDREYLWKVLTANQALINSMYLQGLQH